MKNLVKLVLVFAVAVSFTACGKNTKKDPSADYNASANASSDYDSVVAEEDYNTINDNNDNSSVNLSPVYFKLNEYTLSKENRNILSANAEILKIKGVKNITVEGNCDDRGTISYNIALGQKRANEVRDYYIKLGIPSANIQTISYGEENPVCAMQTESCWAKNRRADTNIK